MIQLKQGKKWALSKKVSTELHENCVLNCFTYSFHVLGFIEHLLHLLMLFYLIFLGVWWLIRFIPQTLRDGREHASSRAQCNGIRSQSHHHRHSKIYQFKGWISHDISMPEKTLLKNTCSRCSCGWITSVGPVYSSHVFFSESNDSFQSFKKAEVVLVYWLPTSKKCFTYPLVLTVGQGLDNPEKKSWDVGQKLTSCGNLKQLEAEKSISNFRGPDPFDFSVNHVWLQTSWWFQPEKYENQIGSFPQVSGWELKKNAIHHLAKVYVLHKANIKLIRYCT